MLAKPWNGQSRVRRMLGDANHNDGDKVWQQKPWNVHSNAWSNPSDAKRNQTTQARVTLQHARDCSIESYKHSDDTENSCFQVRTRHRKRWQSCTCHEIHTRRTDNGTQITIAQSQRSQAKRTKRHTCHGFVGLYANSEPNTAPAKKNATWPTM